MDFCISDFQRASNSRAARASIARANTKKLSVSPVSDYKSTRNCVCINKFVCHFDKIEVAPRFESICDFARASRASIARAEHLEENSVTPKAPTLFW